MLSPKMVGIQLSISKVDHENVSYVVRGNDEVKLELEHLNDLRFQLEGLPSTPQPIGEFLRSPLVFTLAWEF